MARVTVCIPTYQRTQWLAETIASALGADVRRSRASRCTTTRRPTTRSSAWSRSSPTRGCATSGTPTTPGSSGNFTRSLLGATTDYVIQLGDDDVAEPTLVEATVAALDAHPSRRLRALALRVDRRDGRRSWWRRRTGCRRRRRRWRRGRRSSRSRCSPAAGSARSTALIRRSAVPEGGFRRRTTRRSTSPSGCGWPRPGTSRGCREVLCRYRIHSRSFTSGRRRRDRPRLPAGRADAARGASTSSAGTPRAARRTAAREARAARRPRRCARDLVYRVRERTLPDRPFGQTVRGLVDMARREPSLVREPTAWALLAGSVVGSRAVERLKGRA